MNRLSTTEPPCTAHNGVCCLHGAGSAVQHEAHATEVAALHQRIALLERELADARRATPVPSTSPADSAPRSVATTTIEFVDGSRSSHDPSVPAVSSAYPVPGSAAPVPGGVTVVEPDNGFADAWADLDDSDSEVAAARAFFAEGTDDKRARKWLLGDS